MAAAAAAGAVGVPDAANVDAAAAGAGDGVAVGVVETAGVLLGAAADVGGGAKGPAGGVVVDGVVENRGLEKAVVGPKGACGTPGAAQGGCGKAGVVVAGWLEAVVVELGVVLNTLLEGPRAVAPEKAGKVAWWAWGAEEGVVASWE